MKLEERRALTTTEGLSDADNAQLQKIAKLYFGSPGPVTIDDDFAGDALASRVLMVVDLWKVFDGATHAYDLWEYMSDSGTVFRAGSTEVVGEIIQEGLECEDPSLIDALATAIADSRTKPADAAPAKKGSAKKAPVKTKKAPVKTKKAPVKTKKAPAKKTPAKRTPAKKKKASAKKKKR